MGLFGVVEFLMAWMADRISFLIVSRSSFAILRISAIVKISTIVRIVALYKGCSSSRTEFDAELYTTIS